MKIIAEYNVRIPAYSLPYLVNGDSSGLSAEDKSTIDRFMKTYEDRVKDGESLVFSADTESESYFTWHPAFGLACDVYDCKIAILGTEPSSPDYGTCQVCQVESAVYLMYPTMAESRDVSARNPVPMCSDCAFQAFEAGTHESEND